MGDTKHIERWIYTGRHILKGSKLGYGYVDEKNLDKVYYFFKPIWGKGRNGVIGGIYEGEVMDTDSLRVSIGWKFIDKHGDTNWVAEREARSLAEEATHRSDREVKTARVDKETFKRLDPIRKVYQAANSAGRQAILAEVLEYLTRR